MDKRDGNKFAALMIGFAAVTIGWFALQTFTPGLTDSLGDTSPWFYGPATLLVWGVISAIAWFFLRRASRRADVTSGVASERPPAIDETPSGRLTVSLRSEAARQHERDKIAALTSGFAITVAAWLVMLSYFPAGWIDAIGAQPPWLYSVASIVFWVIAAQASYVIFRRGRMSAEANRDIPT